jgi:D-glycero-alpha-D-manno-heptose-7-phosphate kinase
MIITRTPFRISFFGGGTDFPAWYEENGGAVLSTTINKYCYISCRNWPPFFEASYRICYSQIELVNAIDEIQHPSVQACLNFVKHDSGLEITHNADLPSRTGLGSSSTFTVGLLHALYGLRGQMVSKRQLADLALHIEQNVIGENVGSQDQVAVAHGGFNLITFGGPEHYNVQAVPLDKKRLREMQSHLLLFYSGISRFASEVEGEKIRNLSRNKRQLMQMTEMVVEATDILLSKSNILEFGKLLHESWMLKRSLSASVSNDRLDGIYEAAIRAGAVGGKLLGAGGGGFFLIFAPPRTHASIIKALDRYLLVPFSFERSGTQMIFYSPEDSYDAPVSPLLQEGLAEGGGARALWPEQTTNPSGKLL